MTTPNNAGVGNNGGGTPSEKPVWMSSLPDAYKESERFSQFKEPKEAWERFDKLLEAEGRSVAIPDEKATDEERAAFYNKLGRPEKIEGYELKKPEKLPEGVPYSPEMVTAFSNLAFNAGLSKSQAAKVHDWYFQSVMQGVEMQKKADEKELADSVDALKNEWKGDNYKTNEEIAIRGFKTFAKDIPDAVALFESAKVGNVKLGNHPAFLKLFHSIGKAIMDDSAHSGGDKGFGELSDEDKAKAMFPSMAG